MQDAWNQAVPGFEAGELDVAIVPSTEIDRVKADPKLGSKLQQLPISGSVIMIFDTKNKPTDNASIRLALSLAVDRQTLAEKVLKAAYAPAISLSPPDLASHNPDKAAGYAYDVAKAKQLLADAGYPDGKGFPAFELTFWSQEREGLIAQAIKAMWKENLGIDITLQTLEPKAMRDWRIARNEQPFNAYLGLNWSGISDPREFHNAILDPNNSLKRSRYDNQQYVDLIRNAVKELDPAKRAELYKQAEEIVNTDVPIISLIYEGRTWLVEPYVVNFAAVTTAVAEMIRYAAPPGLDTTR
jgi:oligopeptide transport system substrate-binding protein